MKVLILGAGSLGIYVGVSFLKEGNEVHFVGGRKLRDTNTKIFLDDQVYHLNNVFINSASKDLVYDIVFITCKLFSLKSILSYYEKSKILTKYCFICTNGFLDKKLLRGIIEYSYFIEFIIFNGYKLTGSSLLLNSKNTEWFIEKSLNSDMVIELMVDNNIPCVSIDNFQSRRVEKFIMNAATNALSALHLKTLYELWVSEKYRNEVEDLLHEAYQVMHTRYKIRSFEETKEELFSFMSKMNHYSSMCDDLKKGETEIDYINGYIIKLAKDTGTFTPKNDELVLRIKGIAS